MTHVLSVSFDDEVFYSEEFQKLRRTRQASRTINLLLREHLKVKEQAVPNSKVALEEELQELAARKALLQDKKATLEKEEKEQQERFKQIG
jgi:hypothetical protein